MAGLLQCQLAAGVAQRAGGCHREAFVGEQQGQGFGRIRIVVDDQCMGHEISGVDSQSEWRLRPVHHVEAVRCLGVGHRQKRM